MIRFLLARVFGASLIYPDAAARAIREAADEYAAIYFQSPAKQEENRG